MGFNGTSTTQNLQCIMDISALSEATSLDDERNGDPDTSPAHEGLLSALTNGVSQAPHGDNKFQSAISAWRSKPNAVKKIEGQIRMIADTCYRH